MEKEFDREKCNKLMASAKKDLQALSDCVTIVSKLGNRESVEWVIDSLYNLWHSIKEKKDEST